LRIPENPNYPAQQINEEGPRDSGFMRDIELDIRMELLRAEPELTLSQASEMIADVARCYFDVQNDNAAHGAHEWQDFWNLSMLKHAALVTIYRQSFLEILVFPADETLIHESEHLAASEVKGFLELIGRKFRVPDTGPQIPMSEALPWMEGLVSERNNKISGR
jgi:hypothetical protein